MRRIVDECHDTEKAVKEQMKLSIAEYKVMHIKKKKLVFSVFVWNLKLRKEIREW